MAGRRSNPDRARETGVSPESHHQQIFHGGEPEVAPRHAGAADETDQQPVDHLFPEARIDIEKNGGERISARSRFRDFTYQYKLELETPETLPKESVYRHLVRSMFREQIRWIRNRDVTRKISADNAVSSLRMAECAEKIAQHIRMD